MRTKSMNQTIAAEHGIIASFPDEFFGYFGWPSVARMDDGTLVVVASGLRNAHVCPFGRTILCKSEDEGRTWTTPTVVNDLPIDDRDAGILNLGGQSLLLSWFTSDTRRLLPYAEYCADSESVSDRRYAAGFRHITDATVARWLGSWVRRSEDGGETWGPPIRVPVIAPHGPIRLADGTLLYLGKAFNMRRDHGIVAYRSADAGLTWQQLGHVPVYPGTTYDHYHEPHAVEWMDGSLLGLIRVQNRNDAPQLESLGIVPFSLMETTSTDGGMTWTPAQPLGFHGSPPHLLRHSSGALVAVYGYRLPPYGQRAMICHPAEMARYEGGATWAYDYILRDDGPSLDLGYPASVELADGSLFTVYYQKIASAEEKCSLLWTRWNLPDREHT
ncbi:MAG: exo-alpha-sialidase [Anaerolineae bacterium]|nr:exo-alpha-sialidase [Anaerolineae bacterium]